VTKIKKASANARLRSSETLTNTADQGRPPPVFRGMKDYPLQLFAAGSREEELATCSVPTNLGPHHIALRCNRAWATCPC
jgi:hypothetical protein